MAQDFSSMDDFREAKNRLKAYTDDNDYESPVYEAVSKRIEDFRKIYKVRVIVEGLVDTTGEGYSRRLAEYWAAINALKEIQEVRDEQKKSKEEENSAKEVKNGVNNSDIHNDIEESNDSTSNKPVPTPVPRVGGAHQLNGDHNSDDNVNDNDVSHQQNNSLIISADINTSAVEEEDKEDKEEDNQKLVNGHNGDGLNKSSTGSSAQNGINGNNNDIEKEVNGLDSNKSQMNGKRSEFICGTTVPTFQPLKKSPVQLLHDFCMERQSPYPFYDTTYRDRIFLIKCRVEFTEEEEKREFFGTGTGNTSKEAKMMAAEDIIQQLSALSLM